MEKSPANPKKFLTKSCFSNEKCRANLLLFSKFDAA